LPQKTPEEQEAMKRKASALTLILITLCYLTVLSSQIPAAKASYHISPDGSISGTDKIRRTGDLYTFTDDIYVDIKVEKSNIMIDGGGFKLEKTAVAGSWGITFASDVHDVTIRNMRITGFGCGIVLSGSGNKVTGCTMMDCYEGILLDNAQDNVITDNTIVNASIRFDESSNNRLRNNRLENSWIGTSWQNDYNDVDSSNTINGKPVYYIVDQHDLTISPIHYPNIAFLILIGCTGITIRDISFSSQTTNSGVTLTYTSNSTVINNSFNNLSSAITLFECGDITITGNSIINNKEGIDIYTQSTPVTIARNHFENNELGISLGMSGSAIYHNNFVNNIQHVYDIAWGPLMFVQPVTYVWEDGARGNFWSNYNGTDRDGDGIGDTPYVINQWSNNTDLHPLVYPVEIEFEPPVQPEPIFSPSPAPTPAKEPFQASLVFVASTGIALAVIGLLAYLKKRHR
jgi:parallel beta-helix repeat protein